jgi:large subunit ribosomal protein L9
MELLLLEDIPGVGSKNDIIVVKEGFALNNLLPRRRALVATPAVRKRYAEQIRRRAEEKVREIELQKSAVGVLKDIVLEFVRKASKNGKLYAAVSAKDIAEVLEEKHQVEVSESDVLIDEEIKSLGAHTAKVKLGPQGEVPVKIEVKTEGEDIGKK